MIIALQLHRCTLSESSTYIQKKPLSNDASDEEDKKGVVVNYNTK
jgi:hypothetical protein